MALHRRTGDEPAQAIRPEYALDGQPTELPVFQLPAEGLEPRAAYQAVHDELMLEGNPRLNLATFVTTWMEPEARAVLAECADKNLIDKDEYPLTAELERRCVNMLADLWH